MIFIGYQSALQFLLTNGTPLHRALGSGHALHQLKPTQAQPRPRHIPEMAVIEDLGIPYGIVTPKLHVVVADKQSRSQSRKLVSHVWNGPRMSTYLRIDNTYCVATPEACFVQLAGVLPLAHLVELAMLLCGTYAPQPYERGLLSNVTPLSKPKSLQDYVNRLQGKRGLDNARIAARLATAGAASPMEAKIATMLALSTRHGGMGIPAQLNPELILTPEARALSYAEKRSPDFLWPEYGLAMEYDSKTYHDDKQTALADEQRRNQLAAMGLTSIVARPHHFKDLLAFEGLMGQVFGAMGKPMRSNAKLLPEKRARLFEQLFNPRHQFEPFQEG